MIFIKKKQVFQKMKCWFIQKKTFHPEKWEVTLNKATSNYIKWFEFFFSNVGRVSIFLHTHQIWFSQNNLQKVLIFTLFEKNWIESHNVDYHKFENSKLPFSNSHKPIINFFSNKRIITKISNKILILVL
jgi:hypothetical protein